MITEKHATDFRPHTNLRILIPKWRAGSIARVRRPREQLAVGNFVDWDGVLLKVVHRSTDRLVFYSVDLVGRKLRPNPLLCCAESFIILGHQPDSGW